MVGKKNKGQRVKRRRGFIESLKVKHDRGSHLFIFPDSDHNHRFVFTAEHVVNNTDWSERFRAAILIVSVCFAILWALKIAFDVGVFYMEMKK